jgi:hypothetical protein
MSVAVPVVDSWNGETRRIFLKQGVTGFHWIDDIYKEYRNWRRTDEASRKWAALMSAAGNNPKGGGKFTPRYITLLDGARVVPYDENILIVVTGEAITDNADVDPDPFDTTTRTQALKLYITPPSSELVRAEAEIAAVQRMSFDGMVTIDTVNGVAGTDGLKGNGEFPVNNFADALLILQERGLMEIMVINDATLDSGLDYSNLVIRGMGPLLTRLTVSPAANVSGSRFKDASVMGTLDTNAWLEDCELGDLSYLEGRLIRCALEGVLTLGGDGALLVDCYSTRLDPSEIGIIDINGAHNVAIHNFSGHLKIRNMTGGYAGISFIGSGNLTIEDTCTGGMIHVMGNVKLTDNSAGATVLTNYVTSPDGIADAVWNRATAEGADTFSNLLRGMAAALFGKSSGGGTATVTFRDVNDVKDRVVATVDVNKNRTNVVMDLT